ncbi:MAG: hypothetical protein ACFFD4_40040, partial [Candidatus Odinarchaeota archaeon]
LKKLFTTLDSFIESKDDIEVIKEDLKTVLSQLEDDVLLIEIIQNEIKSVRVDNLNDDVLEDISEKTIDLVNNIFKGSKSDRIVDILTQKQKHTEVEMNRYLPLLRNYESLTEKTYGYLYDVRQLLEKLE